MGYYATSDLDADNAASRHAAACTCHTCETRSFSITRFLQDFISTDTTSNNNNTNDDQNKPIDKNFVNRPGNNQQNTFTPLHQASVVRPTSLSQLSHVPAHAYNATARSPGLCIHPYGFTHNAHFPYNISLSRTPIETAAYKQIGQPMTSVSDNYLGNPYLAANQSANIPDELNTSVWLINLPPGLDHKTLFANVRNCGKVWAAVINGTDHRHITAAAKIVFFDVAGAQNLLRQAREGKFVVGGFIPRVVPNRIKTEAQRLGPHSRVLHIEGPSCVVNQRCLTALFNEGKIKWEDEEIIILSNNGILTRLEWRFGSYRCQAEFARHLIDRVKRFTLLPFDLAKIWQSVTVHFGVDPCAPKPGNCAIFTNVPETRKPYYDPHEPTRRDRSTFIGLWTAHIISSSTGDTGSF
ncbi:hypothetical protein F4782DRAFT_533631 [Xylaria castorea]|nr:hypothetical protein F4782DRAFT_533631 [Xylaria castorea]